MLSSDNLLRKLRRMNFVCVFSASTSMTVGEPSGEMSSKEAAGGGEIDDASGPGSSLGRGHSSGLMSAAGSEDSSGQGAAGSEDSSGGGAAGSGVFVSGVGAGLGGEGEDVDGGMVGEKSGY